MNKTALALVMAASALAAAADTLVVKIAPGECWWGLQTRARTVDVPFRAESAPYSVDLARDNNSNQAAPVMVSSDGRSVWCDAPFRFALTNGVMTFAADGARPELNARGSTLAEAFADVCARHFPPSGRTPPEIFVTAPQYNSWIELTYNQNQRDLLRYAQNMLDLGFPPGVLMIDDTWQFGYGTWEFDPRRFPDPKAMCDELHAKGFKLMLWTCPFVSLDSQNYRDLMGRGGLLRYRLPAGERPVHDLWDGQPVPVRWWNGLSAVLDFSNLVDREWFGGVLTGLQAAYGIDGFKFDAGDTTFYLNPAAAPAKAGFSAVDQNAAWSDLGLEYPYNEFRASWKHGGQPLVQRLCDKGHSWRDLSQLIPNMICAGLIGHSFVCPDMIGGGEWTAFLDKSKFDPELFVRSAQVHALCPMMQFSADPSRVLSGEHLEAVKRAVAVRQSFVPYLRALMAACGRDGQPMLRAMEYEFPGRGYALCRDQFMMGADLLVAPQLEKSAKTRKVLVPPGRWTADDGTTVTGPAEIEVATPLSRIPHFVRAVPGRRSENLPLPNKGEK